MALDWERIRIFKAICDAGSLTAAARSLGVGQPALSRQLAQLEEQVGTALVHRHSRGLKPTEAGEILHRAALRMDRVLVESSEEIKDSQESAEGYIKLSVSEALGNAWLLPKMKSFVFRHSRIQMDFQLTDKIVDLRQREADVAIRIGQLSDSDLFQAHLGTFRWKAYVSDGYRNMRGEISRRDYAHVCVLPPESSTGWANQGGKWLRGAVKRSGLTSHQSVVVDSLTGIREAILSTLGIGALPSFLGDPHRLLLEEPTLGEGPELDVYFVCPAELKNVERISLLHSYIRDQFDQELNPQEAQRIPGVACPDCAHRPSTKAIWVCTCGHRWNTFDTRGKCPECQRIWEKTGCSACGIATPHEDWYSTTG